MSDTTSLPFASMFTDPTTMGLLTAAGAAGQMAMPTRMPIPFGAALGAAASGFGQGAQRAAQTQLSQAEATQKQLQNLAAAYSLPVQKAQNDWMLNMYQHPEIFQRMFGQSAGAPANAPVLPGQQPASGNAAPGSYSDFILHHEGTAQNPNSSAKGYGGFIDSTWQQFKQDNPSLFATVTGDGRDDPALGAAAVDWYAKKNAPILTAAGVQPTGQALGLAHYLGPQAAAAVMRAPDNAQVSAVLPGVVGQATSDAYLKANPSLAKQSVADLKAQYAGVPTPTFAGNGGTQYAQAGNVATDATPAPLAPAGGSPNAGSITPGEALSQAVQLEARAQKAQAFSLMPQPMQQMMVMSGYQPEDPTMLRQQAQQYRAVALAGPQAAAEAAAKAPYNITVDRNSNVVQMDKNGVPHYLGRLNEVKPVWENGKIVYKGVGGEGIGAAPPPGGFAAPQEAPNIPEAAAKANIQLQAEHGIVPTVPGAPGAQAAPPQVPGGSQPMGVGGSAAPIAPQSLHVAPGVTLNQIPGGGTAITDTRKQQNEAYKADLGEMHEDAAELLKVQQSQQRVLEMRNIAHQLPMTGPGGETRASISNYIHTYMPSLEGTWLTRAAQLPDSRLASEFAKLQLTNAGLQERDAVGARGGYRLTEMYKNANPNLNMVQDANKEIADLQAVSHQMDLDYLNGEQQWGADKGQAYLQGKADYEPIANFDKQWLSQRNPQVYLGATYAMSGRPFAEWSKGLSKEEIGRALDVVKRIDPSTQIMWQDGKKYPFVQPQQ